MPDTFRDAVIKDYQLKLDRGILSPNLVDPKRASIRDECLLVFAKKRATKDMNILKMFVGNRDDAEDYERALRVVNVEKFKPLQTFILKPETNTFPRNVELLAWLIDYKKDDSKPIFPIADITTKSEEPFLENGENVRELTDDEAVGKRGGQSTARMPSGDKADSGSRKIDVDPIRKYRRAITALSIAIAVAIGSFLFHKLNSDCMYWDGQQYVEVECDVTVPAADVIPKDESALQHLKWITDTDTISTKHIGKIWYIRNDHQVELFTFGGQYPLDRKRRLFLLSKTIYNNYVVPKKVRVKW